MIHQDSCPSTRHRHSRWPSMLGGTGFAVSLLLCCGAWADSQDAAEGAPADTGASNRVTRLQDSLANAQEWHIGVPELQTATSFEDRIRAGNALDSEAYLALDGELRQVRQALSERPGEPQVRQRLAEVRRALSARVESNMNLGYLYAARVYIALLEDAGASSDQVAAYRQQLAEISQS